MSDSSSTHDSNVERNRDPSSLWTVLIGVLSILILVVTIIALEALYFEVENREIEKKVYSAIPTEVRDLKSKQLTQLHHIETVDAANGITTMDIDDAIKIEMRDLKANQAR